jgi:very-short-patch-repair endonuclease
MALPIEIQFARALRKNQTPAEARLWQSLRARRLIGYKFLRQHPIIVSKTGSDKQFYIADFYCAEKKLVIELDGGIHAFQIACDEARDIVMNELGLQVLRFANERVYENVYEVLHQIKTELRRPSFSN